MKRIGAAVLLGMMVAGCGGSGGELREATERRRAETAGLDSATADSTAPSATGAPAEAYRVPAFVDTTAVAVVPAAATPGAAPAADTTPATPASPNPPSAREWSAAARSGRGNAAGVTTLREMRVGRNTGFDRLVIDFGSNPVPSYEVAYVDSPQRCGSGDPARVAGQRWLRIRLRSAQAHDGAGKATVTNREITPVAMPVLREVEMVCDYESEVEIVMGVQTANPYRVLVEPSPNRLIVDVRQ